MSDPEDPAAACPLESMDLIDALEVFQSRLGSAEGRILEHLIGGIPSRIDLKAELGISTSTLQRRITNLREGLRKILGLAPARRGRPRR